MLVLVAWQSAGMAQAPVYGGKTITIIAGTKAGDVYDSYARLFAQHLPKYIPGNPNIIVQNMPGAGSMLAGGRFGPAVCSSARDAGRSRDDYSTGVSKGLGGRIRDRRSKKAKIRIRPHGGTRPGKTSQMR